MSTSSSSSLSAGLQVLSNDGFLPSNLTAQQLQKATTGQLTQLEVANVESNAVSFLFNPGASASDSVNLSSNLSSSVLSGSTDSSTETTDPLLQALETAVTNSTSTTANSSSSASSTNPTSDTIGTLFSYLG